MQETNGSKGEALDPSITKGERIVIDKINKIVKGEEDIVRSDKRRDKLLIFAFLIIIFLAGFFIWYATHAEERQAALVKEFTTSDRVWKYSDLGCYRCIRPDRRYFARCVFPSCRETC